MANVRDFASHNQPSCKTFKDTIIYYILILFINYEYLKDFECNIYLFHNFLYSFSTREVRDEVKDFEEISETSKLSIIDVFGVIWFS